MEMTLEKKRAVAIQRARQQDDEDFFLEQQKKREDVASAFTMPMLIMAAQVHGFKPKSPGDSMRKKAEGAMIYLMSLVTSNGDPIDFITQTLAMSAMAENEEFTRKGPAKTLPRMRPRPPFIKLEA